MSGVTLQPAQRPDDIEALRQLCWDYRTFLLNNSAIDKNITETFYPVPKYQALMDELPQLHARPKGLMLLARDAAGTPLGCGMTHAIDPATSEIKRVFVSASGRGQGIAHQICTELVKQARADGFKRMVLDTSKSLVAAQSLYARLGFTLCASYQPIPSDMLPHLLFYERTL